VTEDELSVMRSKVGIGTVTTASKCMHSNVVRFCSSFEGVFLARYLLPNLDNLVYDKQNVSKDVVGVA
jgi:hypothetical protein